MMDLFLSWLAIPKLILLMRSAPRLASNGFVLVDEEIRKSHYIISSYLFYYILLFYIKVLYQFLDTCLLIRCRDYTNLSFGLGPEEIILFF